MRIDCKFRNCISKFYCFYTCLFDFSQKKLDNIRIYSNVTEKEINIIVIFIFVDLAQQVEKLS